MNGHDNKKMADITIISRKQKKDSLINEYQKQRLR